MGASVQTAVLQLASAEEDTARPQTLVGFFNALFREVKHSSALLHPVVNLVKHFFLSLLFAFNCPAITNRPEFNSIFSTNYLSLVSKLINYSTRVPFGSVILFGPPHQKLFCIATMYTF